MFSSDEEQEEQDEASKILDSQTQLTTVRVRNICNRIQAISIKKSRIGHRNCPVCQKVISISFFEDHHKWCIIANRRETDDEQQGDLSFWCLLTSKFYLEPEKNWSLNAEVDEILSNNLPCHPLIRPQRNWPTSHTSPTRSDAVFHQAVPKLL